MASKKNKRKQIKAAQTAQPTMHPVDIDQISPAASVTQSARSAYDVGDIVINPEGTSSYKTSRRPASPIANMATYFHEVYSKYKEWKASKAATTEPETTPDATVEGVSAPLSTREMMARNLAEGHRITSVVTPMEPSIAPAAEVPVEYAMPMNEVPALPVPTMQNTVVATEQPPVLVTVPALAFLPISAILNPTDVMAAHFVITHTSTLFPQLASDNDKEKDPTLNPYFAGSNGSNAGQDARIVARQHPVATGRGHLARAYAGAYPLRLLERLDAEMAAVQSTATASAEPAKPNVMLITLKKLAASVIPFTRSMLNKLRSAASRVMHTPMTKKMMAPSPFTGTVSSLEDHVRAHVANPTHTRPDAATLHERAVANKEAHFAKTSAKIAAASAKRKAAIAAEYADPTPAKTAPLGSRVTTAIHALAATPVVMGLRLMAASVTGRVNPLLRSSYALGVGAISFATLVTASPLQQDQTPHIKGPDHTPTFQTPTMQRAALGGQNFVQPQPNYGAGPILLSASTLGMTAQAPIVLTDTSKKVPVGGVQATKSGRVKASFGVAPQAKTKAKVVKADKPESKIAHVAKKASKKLTSKAMHGSSAHTFMSLQAKAQNLFDRGMLGTKQANKTFAKMGMIRAQQGDTARALSNFMLADKLNRTQARTYHQLKIQHPDLAEKVQASCNVLKSAYKKGIFGPKQG